MSVVLILNFSFFKSILWLVCINFTFFTPCRNLEAGDIEDISLDAIFSEDDSDLIGDDFESDGYLSKVVEYTVIA